MDMDMFRRAYAMGEAHGLRDKENGICNDSPLSGEWAGESIPELLGDLYREVGDDGDLLDALCDEYEKGYESTNWREPADYNYRDASNWRAWHDVMGI